MDLITPQEFRAWLIRYSGHDRPTLNSLLEGTPEDYREFAGGRYTPEDGTLDLRRVAFNYCRWHAGPLWSGVQAQNSQWVCCYIPGADFSYANLSSEPSEEVGPTKFHMTDLPQVKFREAILNGAHFLSGGSHQGRFQHAKALGSTWKNWRFGAQDDLSEEESYTDLSDMDFSGSHLERCDFARCRLDNVNFEGCVFTNCSFLLARGKNIHFERAIDKNGFSKFPTRDQCIGGHRPTKRFQ